MCPCLIRINYTVFILDLVYPSFKSTMFFVGRGSRANQRHLSRRSKNRKSCLQNRRRKLYPSSLSRHQRTTQVQTRMAWRSMSQKREFYAFCCLSFIPINMTDFILIYVTEYQLLVETPRFILYLKLLKTPWSSSRQVLASISSIFHFFH